MWQRRVYSLARSLFDQYGLQTVLDVGCGSGEKLLEFFHDVPTCGIEIEPTLSKLMARWPDKVWRQPSGAILQYDLVICADVIEHVWDPSTIINEIKRVNPKLAIISTPDRGLIPGADQNGPPRNPSHIREWNFEEFGMYMRDHFRVVSHLVIDPEQYAQAVVVRTP